MNNEFFRERRMRYRIAMSLVSEMVSEGILTKEESLRASGIIAKKYQVDLSDIWDRNYLINDTDRANIPTDNNGGEYDAGHS